jgi:hypothetical protein
MTDFFDTSNIRDEAEYWTDLTGRIVERATRDSTSSGLAWLARPRTSVIAAVLLMAAASIALWPIVQPSLRDAQWTEAFAPLDDVGRTVAASDGPPTMGALLLTTAPSR